MSSARASLALSALALFVALGGGAVALQGKNSVNSGDIKNESVKGEDVKTDTLRGSDIHDEAVGAADVKAGAIGSPELKDASVAAADVAADGLTGASIDESTLAGLGVTSFDELPHAVLAATEDQTFANNFHDTVEMDEVVSLEDVTFNNTTDRLTINTPGLYMASGWIAWDADSAGYRQLDFRKNFNAGAFFFSGVTTLPSHPSADQMSTTWVDRFDDGDTLELTAAQNSGSDLDTVVQFGRNASLSLVWLGP